MQQLFEYSLNVKSLNVDLEKIREVMGYGNENIPSSFQFILNETLREALKIVKPKCGFTIVPTVQSIPKKTELIIGDVSFTLDKIIFSHLKNITSIALFVGTTGKELDEWLDITKQNGDPLKEYISNLVGSAIAESIAEWTHQKIITYLEKENRKGSNRYSPGYCGWSVSEQHKLFSFFPKDFCGINLIESGLMLPIKSVSGVVGVGENIEMLDYPCEVCKVPHCYKNRIIAK